MQGILQVPNSAKNGYFQGDVLDKATAQKAQFWAMGIVSGPSRHPKDVPFVMSFGRGRTVGNCSIFRRFDIPKV